MAISIQCPQCGKSYNLRDDLAGKRVKCKCGQAFVAPEPAATEEFEDLGTGSDGLSDLFDEAMPPATGGAVLGGPAQTPIQPMLSPGRRPSKDSGMSPLVLTAIIGGGAAVVLFIGLMVFLMTGSKDPTAADDAGKPGSGEATEGLSGFATPEEAFEALQKATVDQDWAAQLAVHAPESRERIVGGAAYTTLMLSQASGPSPEIVEILKKHGIDDSVSVQTPSATQTADMEGMLQRVEKQQGELAAMIKDKSAFYVELMPVLERVSVEMASKLPGMAALREKAEQMQEQAQKAQAEAKLIDVEITGDTAQGKRQVPFQGRTLDVPVHFRRIDQRWYIHQPTAREAMEMGRKIGQAITERMGKGDGQGNAP